MFKKIAAIVLAAYSIGFIVKVLKNEEIEEVALQDRA